MWYLQSGTLPVLVLFVLLAGLGRKVVPQKGMAVLLPIAELCILAFISERLCLFYILYCAAGLLGCKVLFRFRKRGLFLLLCLLALVPFFMSRSDAFGLTLPFFFVSIGISFQMLKLIDAFYYVYYAELPVEALPFLNYMLFLPVFTAGPIFRYRDFVKTFAAPLPLTLSGFADSVKRAIRGMFKKVVLCYGGVWLLGQLAAMPQHWYVSLCTVVMSYLVLYWDLSGYSDVAIAFGKVAGYDVPENFKKPWRCPSFTQFWRSWHATLSDWIREHIFLVLGYRKFPKWASGLIGLATMVLMALWHGFNLPYLLAGVYNGVLLGLENLLGLTTVNKRRTKKPVYVLRCVAVNVLFALNTLVFTLSVPQVLTVLRGFAHL